MRTLTPYSGVEDGLGFGKSGQPVLVASVYLFHFQVVLFAKSRCWCCYGTAIAHP